MHLTWDVNMSLEQRKNILEIHEIRHNCQELWHNIGLQRKIKIVGNERKKEKKLDSKAIIQP